MQRPNHNTIRAHNAHDRPCKPSRNGNEKKDISETKDKSREEVDSITLIISLDLDELEQNKNSQHNSIQKVRDEVQSNEDVCIKFGRAVP